MKRLSIKLFFIILFVTMMMFVNYINKDIVYYLFAAFCGWLIAYILEKYEKHNHRNY